MTNMPGKSSSPSLRYASAVAAIAIATWLRMLLTPDVGITLPFITYFPAVMFVAWYGGLGPTLLATGLGALAALYFFIPPDYSLLIVQLGDALGLAIFIVAGIFNALLAEAWQRAASRASENAAAHAESSKALSTTLMSIGDAVIATDVQGRVTLINPVAQSLTGYSESEAAGRHIREVFRIVNEQTRKEVENPVEKVLREGKIVGLANHTVLISKAGSEIPIDDSGAPILNDEGSVIGVVLVFRDISGRRRAEAEMSEGRARLSGVIDSAMDAIITIDENQRVVLFNYAAEEMFNCRADEAVGQPIERFIPEKFRAAHSDHIRSFGEARVTRRRMGALGEISGLRSDGIEFPIEASISQINAGGQKLFTVILRDITERKRAESEKARLLEQVEHQQQQLNNIVSSVPGVVWEAWGVPDESAQRIDFVSDYVESMLGYSVEEWLRTPNFWLQIVHPEDQERAASEAHAIFNSGKGGTSRFRWITKDGRVLWVEAQSVIICDKDGAPIGMRGVTMDITERKLAEEALRESEERFRILTDSAPVLIWVNGLEGCEFVNRSYLDFLGVGDVDVKRFDWAQFIHPDDRDAYVNSYLEAFANQKQFEAQFRFRRADGEYRWMKSIGLPRITPAGDFLGYVGSTLDISDVKQTEESGRFLAETSRLLSGSLDYETTLASISRMMVPQLADWCAVHIVEASGAVRQLTVSHVDEAKVEWARELERKYPYDPDAPTGVSNVLRTGRPEFYPDITDELIEASSPDEERRQIIRELGMRSAIIAPLVARGRTLGALTLVMAESGHRYDASDLALAEDVANRAALAVDNARLYGEAQEALRLRDEFLRREQAAREESEAANRAKDEFLATVSHELRTPLNAILGWSHMLRHNEFDEKTEARALETIERNARSQAQLIEDILDVSRIVTGKLRLDVQPVELAPVIEAAIQAIQPAADAKEIRIQTILDPRAGPVSGDATRLQQVAWNLLSNAVKFTGRGGRVVVRLERVNSHIEMIVSDTGQGINGEFLPHVFDRFRQADATSTRRYGGLGLGLAIVRHIVEMHGGTVEAESDGDGKGATFIVKLPIMVAHSEKTVLTNPRSVTGSYSSTDEPSLGSITVMVVEDERDARDLLEVMLKGQGAEVIACASTAEAIERFASRRPDVIVSDIEMPGADGYDFIRMVRELEAGTGEHTPALALTAYARAEDRLRALSAGYEMHLAKPADPAELALVISSLARRGRNLAR